MNLANKITILRIALIPFLILLLQPYPEWLVNRLSILEHFNQWGMYYAAILFLITAGTDKLDGYIARKYNMVTNLGKLLDPLADKLLVSVTLIMLVSIDMIPSWMAIVIIGREAIITAIRGAASSRGIVLAADRHGKIKMVLQIVGITAVMLNHFLLTKVTELPIAMLLMVIAVGVTIYSGMIYIVKNYKKLELNFE
jgi:CDP-diacylglycerol--glycerol-3-phosphate 3-phosphatidyltransferase